MVRELQFNRKIIYIEHLCFLYNYKTGKSLITLMKICDCGEECYHKYPEQGNKSMTLSEAISAI